MRQALPFDRLFASDLDGTLIDHEGDQERALARFLAWRQAHPTVCVAYVTGRHFEHAIEGIESAGLPTPDFLVTDVGTTIREPTTTRAPSKVASDWLVDTDYHETLRRLVGERSLEQIDAGAVALVGVRRQPPERCGPFKRSFFVEPGVSLVEASRAIEKEIDVLDLCAHAVVSRDPWTGEGLVDVLVSGVTKASAVAHLRDRTGVDDASVVYCGDSGNDVAALVGPWHGIVVANATADLLEKVVASPSSGRLTRTHLSRHRVIEGVLEGLAALGWAEPPVA